MTSLPPPSRYRPRGRIMRCATAAFIAALFSVASWTAAPGPASAANSRFMMVAGTASMGISVLRVADDGSLSSVPNSPFPTGFGVLSLVLAPDGRTVYVPHAGGFGVSGYRLDDNGTLHPVPGADITVGGPPTAAALSPDGKQLFVVVGGAPGHVESFAVTASGALVPSGAPTVPVDGFSAVGMAAVDPSGRFLRVVTYLGNTMSNYAISPDGTMTPLGAIEVKLGPVAPGFSRDGRYLYVSNEFGFDLSGFVIGENGQLSPTPGSPYPTHGVPHGAVVTADNTRLYVPNAMGQSIAGFDLHSDGRLVELPGSPYAAPAATLPGQVALHPDGKTLYLIDVLTAQVTTRVHTYTIREDGSLAPSGRPSVDTGVVMSDGPVVALTP
ncbi:6-phosphogluconolactonase (cycloisomerase 2 family) [Nocardia caishijiensis]|uniref:6-phosphogluconolactonase (Cycloisomerase 2 family) n=2 Tax=Nocardia caishijiensis TaxID=184756 RepID=A0ABQ6YLJ6_9NOCA|nr:6-phosphogluconolactonase (cycloisomerase 2 family) [Nocardia caishijiensis]